jgi:hypothetical protein
MHLWYQWFRPDIQRLKQTGDRAGLLAALSHREDHVRLASAAALAETGEEHGVRYLLSIYAQPTASQALDTLVRLANLCTPALSTALADGDIHIRHRAALALASLGERGPVECVIRVLLRDHCEYLSGTYEDRGGVPVQRLLKDYGQLAVPILEAAVGNAMFDQTFVAKALKTVAADRAQQYDIAY